MKNFTQQTAQKNDSNAEATAMRLFVLLVLMLMSCSGVFGQNKEEAVKNVITVDEVIVVPGAEVTAAVATESQMDLVIWFMGSKQVKTKGAVNASGSATAVSGKKQFMNAGLTPNRILSRTFMKKAINYESTIA